jgi:hypothetical protein
MRTIFAALVLTASMAFAACGDASDASDSGATATPQTATATPELARDLPATPTPAQASPPREDPARSPTSVPAVETRTSRGPAGGTKPPAASAVAANGSSVELGIGTYCWNLGSGGLCVDAVGPVTGTQTLAVERGTMISVANPAAGMAISGASVVAWQAPAAPIASGANELVWSIQPDTGQEMDATVAPDGVRFAANLPAGRYVVAIMLFFQGNDVSYGLLLDVQ